MSFLKKYGQGLLNKGYPIIPIKKGYKFPKGLSNWQSLKSNTKLLDKWSANGFADGGVGVLTKNLPAVDIDVHDKVIVKKLVVWCNKNIGATIKRVGLAPKVLLAFRTEKPFTKIASKTYLDFLGAHHKVEVLGDGQQYVAFAEHPDTRKPYTWLGNKSLLDTNIGDLPTITAEQALNLVDYFEKIIPEDWEIIEQGTGKVHEIQDSFSNLKPKINISVEKIEQALDLIPADDYTVWFKVGMALYHQFDGSQLGFSIWNDWSFKSDKYESTNMRFKWNTFKANLKKQEPITAATILRMARINHDKSQGNLVDQFVKRYIYVQDGDLVCDLNKPPHCSISRLNEFKNRTANIRHEIAVPTQKEPDKTKKDQVWKAWLVNIDRESAEGTEYVPNGDRIITDNYGLDWINEFYMPRFSEGGSKSKLKVFFDHMNYLIPIKKERDWFISWMAFNLQHPEKRCKVTPLHVAIAHGTGRGWVVELMGKLLGQWNIKKTKMNVLAGEGNGGGFHEFLHKSLLCAIEEVKEGAKRFAVSDQIRDLLTENHLEVNIKYGKKKTQRVYTNFFFMSNHPDALVLTNQDRRVNVLSGPKEPRSNAYYTNLYQWLETDGVSQLHHYLMGYDLKKFNWQYSIKTLGRSKMIDNNRTETEVLFWDLMNDPPYAVMTFQQIIKQMKKLSDKDEFEITIDEGQLNKLLQHYAEHWGAIKVAGKTHRPWAVNKNTKLDNKKVREEILKCGI